MITLNSALVDQNILAPQAINFCIACGGSVTFLGERLNFTYGVCRNCNTVQLSPIPNQADVERAYTNSQYATAAHGQINPDEIRKTSRPYYASLARALKAYAATGGIVDYGAGWGGLCELLLDRGFSCRGLELAGEMVAECQRRGLPVEQKDLSALVREGVKVHALVLCGVFEHLLDPMTFLRDAYEVLEDDGLLVSLQPAATFARLLASASRLGNRRRPLPSLFWVFDPPWHVALYSVPGMRQLAAQAGFELAGIRFAPQGRMAGAYGAAQRSLEVVNRMGWHMFRSNWPLLTSHIYVIRKKVYDGQVTNGRFRIGNGGAHRDT